MKTLRLPVGVIIHPALGRAKPQLTTHQHTLPPVLGRIPRDVPQDLHTPETFPATVLPSPRPLSQLRGICHFPQFPGSVLQKLIWL